MSHLVQPVEVYGTHRCVMHGSQVDIGRPWRTVSVLDGEAILSGAEDDDSWIMFETSGGSSLYGIVIFGTCCIQGFTLRFALEPTGGDMIGNITLNGVVIEDFERFGGNAGEIIDFPIDLSTLGVMDRACGNEWTIFAGIDNADTGYSQFITASIIDVF